MNEVFDIKRLGKLMQYEVINYIPHYFKSLLIFASVIAAVWILSLTIEEPIMPGGRDELVKVLFVLAITLSPFIVYKDMNNRKKGYIYAMIPASTLEKLLSMIVLCVVIVPLLAYAVLTATDLLLWLLSKVGIGTFLHMEFYNPFTSIKIVDDEYLLPHIYPVFDSIIYFVNLVAYTIMFNTIFRKNKVFKTILFNISMTFAFVILTAVIVNITTPEFWENLLSPFVEWLDEKTDVELFGYVMTTVRCLTVLMSMAFLYITYFRIKKVNY
ncbi:MAG: hypothetical protein IKY85_02130 [Bacteroidaceae bacterium]|nr:hypothetical protein [Bacteroidaceae bacterium]